MGLVVVFQVESRRFGLPLEAVERVVRAVEITALPRAPAVVLGVINVQGHIVPVVDVRARLHLPLRSGIGLADQLLIARTQTRVLALIVDGTTTVAEYSAADFTGAAAIVPGLEYLSGVVVLPDGILLVQDLDRFLSLQETQALDEALGDA
jgi:purine-binding chemotaxis protein CheW